MTRGRGVLIAAAVALTGVGGAALWYSQTTPDAAPPAQVAQAPAEPAPLPEPEKDDLSNEALFLSDGGDDYRLLDPDAMRELDVEGVITSLSDLDIPVTKRTMRYVKQFGAEEKGKRSWISRFTRGNKYRGFIERELLLSGLPQDLVWVAAIESGFRPEASSPKGAMGLFQFMPETGAHYGLLQTTTIDERRSIPKSTRAMIAHFESLYERYGSWDLALAAYNCGEGRVDAALEKAAQIIGEREDPILFHDLAERKLLPRETLDYVPMIQAFAIVAHNRAQLQLDDLKLLDAMSFGEVAVPLATPLATVAIAADLSISDLREYNPDLLSDTTGDGEGDTIILVPAERLSRVSATLPTLLYGRGAKSTGDGESADDEESSDEEVIEEPESEEAAPTVLRAIPGRPGAFLLSSGVVVVVTQDAALGASKDVKVGATITLRDAKNPDKAISTHVIEERTFKQKQLNLELKKLHRDIVTQARSVAAPKLYASVASSRRKQYSDEDRRPFEILSNKIFRLGHSLHGSMLVGPTRQASERVVSVEPFWAVETTVTIKGNVTADKYAELFEEVLTDPIAPRRLPRLPDAAHVRFAPIGKEVLLGWGMHPFTGEEEVAAEIAFALACDDRIGRVPMLAVRERKVATKISCGMETSPGTVAAWFRASPKGEEVATTLETTILEGLVGITGNGPSEDELDSARDHLRAEWQRRIGAAKSDVEKRLLERDNERMLGKLDDVKRETVLTVARKLFATKRRILITWDREKPFAQQSEE